MVTIRDRVNAQVNKVRTKAQSYRGVSGLNVGQMNLQGAISKVPNLGIRDRLSQNVPSRGTRNPIMGRMYSALNSTGLRAPMARKLFRAGGTVPVVPSPGSFLDANLLRGGQVEDVSGVRNLRRAAKSAPTLQFRGGR